MIPAPMMTPREAESGLRNLPKEHHRAMLEAWLQCPLTRETRDWVNAKFMELTGERKAA
jgi:hypothetical protein